MNADSTIRFVPTVLLCCTILSVPVGLVAAGPAGEKAVAFSADDPELEWSPCPPLFPEGCEIAVLHGDPAKPNADLFYKVPAGYSTPHHWHTSRERAVLVSGEIHLTYDGQDTVVFKPGMYACGPAKVPHNATCTDASACIFFVAHVAPIDAYAADTSDQ